MTCETTTKTRSVNEWSFIDENGYQYLNNSKFEYIVHRAIRDSIFAVSYQIRYGGIGALLDEQNEIPICRKKELKN